MTGLPPEAEAIRAALGTLLGPFETIERLPSGAGGSSFLVRANGRRYVAKAFAPDAPVLLGPARQFELLRVLADAGIAPRAVACDVESNLLITEFVADAAAVPAAALRTPERIGEVAALLRRLHASSASLPGFTPARYAERYLARIGAFASLAAADRRRYRELLALAELPLAEPACPCHNDLTQDNILLGPPSKLIDFDYAVTAAPVVDLASLAVMNEFDTSDVEVLLDAYYSGTPAIGRREFAKVQRLVRLLAHFWALAEAPAGAAILAQYRIDND